MKIQNLCLGQVRGIRPDGRPNSDTVKMAATDDIRLEHDPPRNPSDIHISSEAIDRLCKAGGLKKHQRDLLDKQLPTSLLGYFLSKSCESSTPTKIQRDKSLKALEKRLKGLQEQIEEVPWVYGALVAHQAQSLLGSKEFRRDLAQRGYPDHAHAEECHLRARQLIGEAFQAVDRLRKGIASLRVDPVGDLVAERRSQQRNAQRPHLDYLHQDLYVLWERVLGMEVSIGPKSSYVAFAKCLLELVGEARSEETVIERLTSAKATLKKLIQESQAPRTKSP